MSQTANQTDSTSSSKLIFVPGAGCGVFEDYPKTCTALEEAGFAITAISPDWKETSFDNLVEQVMQELTSHIGSTALVVAHSRGANIVMPALARQSDIGVIIASPSMTCAEGYENSEARGLAKERFPGQESQVRKVGMFALAQAAKIPATRAAVMVGDQEIETYPYMHDIAQRTAEGFGVELKRVPHAPHFIDYHESYISAIVDEAVRIHENQEGSA